MVEFHKTIGKDVDLQPSLVYVRVFQREILNLYAKERLSPNLETLYKDFIGTESLKGLAK